MTAAADKRRALIAVRLGVPPVVRRLNWRLILALVLTLAAWTAIACVIIHFN